MTFPDAVRRALTNYATFAGRARRSEFWFFYLFLLLMQVASTILDGVFFGLGSGPFGLLVSLGLVLPMIAVAARRLHDGGRSGWWMLVGLVPLVGWIIILFWYVQRGEDGPNRFGPDPLDAPASGAPATGGAAWGVVPGRAQPAPPGGAGRPWPVNGPGQGPGQGP